MHAQIVGQFQGIQLKGKDEYIVQAPFVPELIEYARSLDWQVQEQPLLKSKDVPENAAEESGAIENCKEGQGAKSKYWTVKWHGAWIYCYSKTLGPRLLTSIGKQARLMVVRKEGKAPTIEGAVQVGSVYYEADGKTERR